MGNRCVRNIVDINNADRDGVVNGGTEDDYVVARGIGVDGTSSRARCSIGNG